MNNDDAVYFAEPEYYMFSNFSAFAIEWKGEIYMTSEHVYHSERFNDELMKKDIRNARSAYDAFIYAQNNKHLQVINWNDIKLEVMKAILLAKVEQHPYIKQKLIETGSRELIKNIDLDDFWGWGPHKDGANHLGRLWMEIRDEVRKEEGVKE